VKANLILARIAEKEKIQASREEMTNRILWLAQQNQIKPEKLVKQMQDQGGLNQLAEQIVHGKVLDLMELHAKVEEVAPAAS
jgi:FKBP-type peptidyl-prolyl cis-trans isomerase (trigger factor)